MYGCGCWAQDGNDKQNSVASSTSGCGEYLMRTMLAKEAASDLLLTDCGVTTLHGTLVKKFLGVRTSFSSLSSWIHTTLMKYVWKSNSYHSPGSPFLIGVPTAERLGGVISLKCEKSGVGEFLWAHTTQSFCVGYMSCEDTKPRVSTNGSDWNETGMMFVYESLSS